MSERQTGRVGRTTWAGREGGRITIRKSRSKNPRCLIKLIVIFGISQAPRERRLRWARFPLFVLFSQAINTGGAGTHTRCIPVRKPIECAPARGATLPRTHGASS